MSGSRANAGCPFPPPPPPRSTNQQPANSTRIPDIENYVSPSKDFLEGKRGANPARGQAVARYLQDWERAWESISDRGDQDDGKGISKL